MRSAEGRIAYQLPSHAGSAIAVACAIEGPLLATASGDGTAAIWRADYGQLISQFRSASAECLAFTPDSKTLLVSGRQITCWDLQSTQLIRSLEMLPRHSVALHFAPEGQTMAVTASDGTVIFFDTTSSSALQMLQPGPQGQSHLYRCLFSPDGEMCARLRLRRARRIGQTFLADRYEILVWNRSTEDTLDLQRGTVGHTR